MRKAVRQHRRAHDPDGRWIAVPVGVILLLFGARAWGQPEAGGTTPGADAAPDIRLITNIGPEDLPGPPLAPPTPILQAEGATGSASDLKITGRKSITFLYREYRGGISPYYFSSGYTRQETLNLAISGQIERTVKVDGEFYQSDQDLESKYALKLATQELELFLGDFQAALPDTEFLLEGRNLSGGRFTAEYPGLGGTALVGAAKGSEQYERFYGNRTQGPYYLQQAPVVFGPERILLNKSPQVRGADYTFDYLTGQISFLRRAVDDVTLIEVIYESRQTVYARTLYAGRIWSEPWTWLKIAGSAVCEEDPAEAGIVSLPGGNTLTPMGHWVYGADATAELPGIGTLTGEWAQSRYRSDRLEGNVAAGQAGKAAAAGTLGPVGAKGYFLRTTPDFRRVGGLDFGSDVLGYGGALDVKTGGPYSAGASFDLKDRLLTGIREISEQAQGQAGLWLPGWPEAGYQYFQLRERNDASGTLHLDHLTQRHTGMLEYGGDYFDAGIRAEREKRQGQMSDRSSALTRSAALTAGSKNVPWINLAAGSEFQIVDAEGDSLAAGSVYRATKAKLTGSIIPSDRYSLTADNRWVWDERYGSTRTLDTKLEARPVNEVRADGKYTWETLQSLIGAAYLPVYTQTASGQLEITPWSPLSLRLSPNLRWTTLADNGAMLNHNRTDLADLKWAMLPQASHEADLQRDLYLLADPTDPALRIQTEQENRKALYLFKAAFSNAFSGEATALYEQYYKNNYSVPLAGYDRLGGRHRAFTVGIRSSLQETLRTDASYALDLRDQDGTSPQPVTRTAYPISSTGQTTAQYDMLNSYGSLRTRQDTAATKITYQWTEVFSVYAEGAYNRNEDLTGLEPVIHTAAPGAGAFARWPRFRAEAGAKWAGSWGGISTRQESYSLSVNYTPVDIFSLSAKGTHSLTHAPYSVATEANLNCSVQF